MSVLVGRPNRRRGAISVMAVAAVVTIALACFVLVGGSAPAIVSDNSVPPNLAASDQVAVQFGPLEEVQALAALLVKDVERVYRADPVDSGPVVLTDLAVQPGDIPNAGSVLLEVNFDAAALTGRLVDAGADLVAPAVETPWRSLNSRLDAPGGIQLTLFQELDR